MVFTLVVLMFLRTMGQALVSVLIASMVFTRINKVKQGARHVEQEPCRTQTMRQTVTARCVRLDSTWGPQVHPCALTVPKEGFQRPIDRLASHVPTVATRVQQVEQSAKNVPSENSTPVGGGVRVRGAG